MIFRRLFGPVFIGLLCCVAYYFANQFELNQSLLVINEFYIEQFLTTLSTLYAIVTALVLIKGLETVNGLTAALLREATKVRSIASLSAAFHDDGSRAAMRHVRGELAMYVDNIRTRRDADRAERNDGAIDGCRRIIAGAHVYETELKVALLRELEALRLLRAERGSQAASRVPGYLVWMLLVMKVAILAPFFLEHSTGPHFNYYAIFALSTFGSFIFLMVRDINRPYSGLWRVDFTPMDEAAAELEADSG
ncbi:MAG: hypothetical protein MRY74_10445 [Neomegalonema sp.]|nr:hypothetical protein [Neomegalonema sp.]